MYKIKYCPFCGGRPYLEESHRAFIDGQSTKVCFVRCINCNARSPRFKISDFEHTSRSETANLSAIEAWNKRSHSNKYFFYKTKKDRAKEKQNGEL